MSKRTNSDKAWETAEHVVILKELLTSLKELLTSPPVMAGYAYLFSMFSQSVPCISALGFLGLAVTFMLAWLLLSAIKRLQVHSTLPMNKRKQQIELSPFQKIIQWKWWKWVISVGCFVLGTFFLDLKPNLPSGVSPSEIYLPLASYKEMREKNIVGKTVILTQMPMSSPMIIKDKDFFHCLILGPAVVVATGGILGQCQFDAHSNPEDILLETKSRWSVGAIKLEHCNITQCELRYISFLGNSNSLAKLRKSEENTEAP
jgi:hypothetical protein